MNTTANADDGLRARKRAATQASIERAAISLALEHGYEKTTVDMICEAAMVSQRTFFNYFGSKEGVILGGGPPMPTDAEVDQFVSGTGPDILVELVETITSALIDHEPDAELLRSRRLLIRQTGDLATKELARMSEAEDQFVNMVMERFHAQGRDESTTPDLQDEAKMIVSLAVGVMRYAMRKWFSGNFAGTPKDVLRNSTELIRRVTRTNPSDPTKDAQ
ncbi:MAG: TetR/AcrR family transcriptional regulator [Lacisediminihabitans sp.]